MLRSPVAAQIPEDLRLPLESVIASARAGSTMTFDMNPDLTAATAVFASGTASGSNGVFKRASEPFGGFSIEEQEQQVSPMEGVEISGGPHDRPARGYSDCDQELTAHMGTEFLQALSQESWGGDGNFTQPLSPSIYTAAAARAITENTSGVSLTFPDVFHSSVSLCWPA